MILVSIIGFVVALLEAPTFEVRDIQIAGAARTSQGAVLDALEVSSDQALVSYDVSRGRSAVADLPWVEAVSLTRQWPSTLRVVIRERTVSAAVGHPAGTEWIVVATDGTVVESRLTPPNGVPLIVSPADVVENARVGEPIVGVDRALEIAYALPGQLDPWVTTWMAHEDGSVSAGMVGSATVDFGAHDDHRTQFVSLASILNGGADLVCLEEIDLRIADTPVLHRDPACLIASRAFS